MEALSGGSGGRYGGVASSWHQTQVSGAVRLYALALDPLCELQAALAQLECKSAVKAVQRELRWLRGDFRAAMLAVGERTAAELSEDELRRVRIATLRAEVTRVHLEALEPRLAGFNEARLTVATLEFDAAVQALAVPDGKGIIELAVGRPAASQSAGTGRTASAWSSMPPARASRVCWVRTSATGTKGANSSWADWA